MNFFKALFGGKTVTPRDKQKEDEARNFDVLKYDGVRAMRSGQPAYAVKCFRHALGIREDLEIRDYLSQVLVQSNELVPAFEELRRLAEAQPDNQQIFIRMANIAYMMEDYGAMSDACEKALLIDKDTPLVSYLYARASKGQDDLVNAIALLTRAIALDGNYVDAYLLRGETLLSMGDVQGADRDAQWLLENTHGNEDVMLLKARIEHARGNDAESVDMYTKVIDVNPFSIEAYKERGGVLLEQGDKEGAAADMEKVLGLSPKEVADINGEFSAEGIEARTRRAYAENPLGLG